ncbi:MAG TPA: hypothetical protein VIN60_07765 [Anaerolineales bacterium]
MYNIFGLFFVILFGGAGLISIFIVIGLLFPKPVERTRLALAASPGRSFLLGLINLLCVGALDAVCIWLAQLVSGVKVISGILIIVAGLITLVLALLAFLGLASFANLLGHHISESSHEFHRTMRGGVLLILAGFTPFIGWFAFTPLVVLTGLGAAIQTVFSRQPNIETEKA